MSLSYSILFFFFKQKTAYEMRISDWSSDVCSSDLPDHPLRRSLPDLDLVLTYGGGPPVVSAYRALGTQHCVPIYNALDPDTHHPVAPEPRFACDLAFLGNRLPDREARVEEFFELPAQHLSDRTFLIGGSRSEERRVGKE